MLRWTGYDVQVTGNPVPCDAGGWYPISALVKSAVAGFDMTMEALINVVYHDDKQRFQVAAEIDSRGAVATYFAVRASSGTASLGLMFDGQPAQQRQRI